MLLLAAPDRAHARPAALELPALLRAGEQVEVRWSGLSADVREVELELSLDGGRWVRISPELEAAEGRFRWQVPAVASARARVRLRAGGERFEQVVGVSAEVRIDDGVSNARTRPSSEDWWRLGEHAAAPGQQFASAAAKLAEGRTAGALASMPESDPSLPPAFRVSAPHDQPADEASPLASPARHPATRLHPMRN